MSIVEKSSSLFLKLFALQQQFPGVDIVIGDRSKISKALGESSAEFRFVSLKEAPHSLFFGINDRDWKLFMELEKQGLAYVPRAMSKLLSVRRDQDGEDEFIRLIQGGEKISIAGRKVGWTCSKSHYRAAALGLTRKGQKDKNDQNSQNDSMYKKISSKAANMYNNGDSTSKIAKIFGVSGFTVIRALAMAKVVSKKTGKPFKFQE